ncbi:uncharacterized protein BKCO1_5000166 [Diplodia corticola]|uniref:Uncharacterized protein n=1 Tax=Diplodia corticola TaxID=236234 RepID=A0A1J9RD21_9PEZI|nr:uncharacterized protein BKCO1_5000166 [Diplodia corticola]OJD38010.1 hypothetical protein BKCO1_5000166 [Diplodia corticola]
MPLTELDPNVSGRLSRASNMSAGSRGTRRSTQPQSDMLSSGVMNMLRTSTELGDIGGVSGGVSSGSSFNKSARASQVSRPAHRRRSNYHHSSRVSVGSNQTQTMHGISSKHRSRPSTSSVPRRSITSSLNVPQFVPDTVSPTLMNLPGASPLVPSTRLSKEVRSYSLTNHFVPPQKLSAPRSFTSLRHQEPVQRPRSPYRYPTRLRRPGYRSPSPAMSDVASGPPRRYHGQSSLTRMRTSPVSPMLPHEMASAPFPPGYHRSAQSSGYTTGSPLPLHEMEQILYYNQLNRSAPIFPQSPCMGSEMASRRPMGPNGSTPMLRPAPRRSMTSLTNGTDSDAQSSGPPSLGPQTPRVSHSAEVMVHQAASPLTEADVLNSTGEVETEQALEYYDYSEHFESIQKELPAAETANVTPGGFASHVRSILGENGDAGQPPQMPYGPHTPSPDILPDVAELEGSPVAVYEPEPVELPASVMPSPIPRRITREMILSVIEPSSTANESTTMTLDVKVPMEMDAKVERKTGHPPSPTPCLTPSKSSSSSDSVSSAEEEMGTVVSEGDTQVYTHQSIDLKAGDEKPDRESKDRFSVSMAQDSVESSDTLSIEDAVDTEPQVKLEIPSDPTQGTPRSTEQSVGGAGSLLKSLSPASVSTRAKSMFLTPKQSSVDIKERISAPILTASSPGSDVFGFLKGAFDSSPLPLAASAHLSIPEEPVEVKTPVQTKAPQEELQLVFETPAATPITFTTDESTPGSATVQSTSTHSVPARSYSSRESVNTTTHLVWPVKKPSSQSFEPNEYPPPSSSVSVNNTIAQDLRLSSTPRYPSQLSDVKEESCEESCSDLSKRPSTRVSSNRFSTNFKVPLSRVPDEDLSSSGFDRRTSANFKIPLARGSAASAQGNSLDSFFLARASSLRASNASVFKSPKRGTLADTRLIPSMHFSQMDLVENLHDAFGDRSTLSLDGAHVELRTEYPDADVSLGPIREKYRSFFASLDETSHRPDFRPKTPETVEVPPVEVEDEGGNGKSEATPPIIVEPARSDAMSITSMPSTLSKTRPYSPEELMTEVERLTIPSVAGLTQRLSELLPSLKRYSSCETVDEATKETQDLEKIIEDPELKSDVHELRHLGDRPGLLNTMRSSCRLRAMPGRTTLVIVDDDVYDELTSQCKGNHKDKDIQSPRLEEIKDTDSSNKSFKSARERKDSNSTTPDVEVSQPSLAELEAPMPVHVRGKPSHVATNEPNPPAVSEEVKPWDMNMKFPWNESTTGIDITFPVKAHVRSRSAASRPSRLRLHSPASSEYSTATDGNRRKGSGERQNMTPDSTETHDTFKHSRKGSHRPCRSVMGSVTRKLGLTMGLDGAIRSSVSLDEFAHDPGDRYPTSGLTPPSRFNLDDVRSFFSDDSSQTRHGGTFRKRLTRLRSKIGPPATLSRAQSAVEPRAIERAAGASSEGASSTENTTDSPAGTGGSLQTYDGATGMPKSEFRTKRLFERIKSMWFRSGEFIKSLGAKKKLERQETREWLQDSEVNTTTPDS